MQYFGNSNFRYQAINSQDSKEMKEYEKAVESHKQCLAMRKRLFPGDHKDVADSYHNLGSAYSKIKEYENELENHKQSLAMRKRLFPGDHKDVADSYIALGLAYKMLGDYRQGNEFISRLVKLKQRLGM